MRANRQMTGRVNAKSEAMKPESKGMDLNIGEKKKTHSEIKSGTASGKRFLLLKNVSQCIL